MTLEGFLVLLTIIGGMLTTIGAVIGHWFNRDKTKADAMVTFTVAVTEMVGNVTAMTKMLQDQKDITDQRDERIDELERKVIDLERSNSDKDAVIDALKQDMARLVKSGISKDREIKALNDKIDRWRVERDTDRKRITTLEGERKSLLTELKTLRDMMDSDSKSSENGKKTQEQDKITQETVETDNDAE